MQKHLIRKQITNLRLNSQEHAWTEQQEFVRLYKEEVLPVMDRIFSDLVPAGKTLRLDKLEIDLGKVCLTDPGNKWKGDLERIIRDALKAKISDVQQNAEGIFETTEESAEKSWRYFLESGMLPWWMSRPDFQQWEFAILSCISNMHSPQQTNLIGWFRRHPSALHRMLLQNSAPFQWELFRMLAREKKEIYQPLQKMLSGLMTSGSHVRPFLTVVWNALLTDKVNAFLDQLEEIFKKHYMPSMHAETFQQIFSTLHFPDIQNGMLSHPIDQNPINILSISEKQTTDIYIENAGLVILTPFIPAFFENLGLTENRKFTDDRARNHAALALHYLATGEKCAPEFTLAIEKILCNIPSDLPLDADLMLTENECVEAEELLATVIRHWSKLGACSTDSLRTMFLRRAGKLSPSGGEWILKTENSSFDILLQFLPWGIQMIRFPWMNQFLHVEWNY